MFNLKDIITSNTLTKNYVCCKVVGLIISVSPWPWHPSLRILYKAWNNSCQIEAKWLTCSKQFQIFGRAIIKRQYPQKTPYIDYLVWSEYQSHQKCSWLHPLVTLVFIKIMQFWLHKFLIPNMCTQPKGHSVLVFDSCAMLMIN